MKHIAIVLSLLLLAHTSGCVVEVKERDGGGGGGSSSSAADPAYDEPHGHQESGGTTHSGGSTTHSGGTTRPQSPPPRRRGRYSHLPNMGPTKDYMLAHGTRGQVDRGVYHGDLKLHGRGFIKVGAGIDQTVFDGDVIIKGDNWILKHMTITGMCKIRGSNNDLSTCKILGRKDVRGMGNKLP